MVFRGDVVHRLDRVRSVLDFDQAIGAIHVDHDGVLTSRQQVVEKYGTDSTSRTTSTRHHDDVDLCGIETMQDLRHRTDDVLVVGFANTAATGQHLAVFIGNHFHDVLDIQTTAMYVGHAGIDAADREVVAGGATKSVDQSQSDVSTATTSAIQSNIMHLLLPL